MTKRVQHHQNMGLELEPHVRPAPNPRVEQAQKRCVRFPQDIAATISAGRGGELVDGRWKSGIDQKERTEIYLGPKPAATVIIPAGFDAGTLGRDVRGVITWAMQRHYLVALALSQDQGREDGLFKLREADAAELLGNRLRDLAHTRTRFPSTTEHRVHGRFLQRIEDSFVRWSRIYTHRAGSVTGLAPEAMMQAYAEQGPLWWAPARIVVLATTGLDAGRVHSRGKRGDNGGPGQFGQLPLAVIRLDPERAALGFGLASALRPVITKTLEGSGRYATTLGDLLPRIGANMDQARERGRPFWNRHAEMLPVVAEAGEIGTIHIIGTPGPAAEVIVEPSKLLADAYEEMRSRHVRRVDKREAERAKADAGVPKQRRQQKAKAAGRG